jgi:ribosome-associated protein
MKMNKLNFLLTPNTDFIELVKLLKVLQIAQTGGHAKMMIEDGLISVNGEVEYRKRKKLRVGDHIELEGNEILIEKSP